MASAFSGIPTVLFSPTRSSMKQGVYCNQRLHFAFKASSSSSSSSSLREEDDIDRELAKARALLIEAKKRIAAMDALEADNSLSSQSVTTSSNRDTKELTSVPFFATFDTVSDNHGGSSNMDLSVTTTTTTITTTNKRDIVIKSRNEDGLITVNGEEMAKLSEEEIWTARPLGEVFDQNELNEDEDVYALATESLRERDVAASIFNLRKSMQLQDYKKIFDSKNYFIGEEF